MAARKFLETTIDIGESFNDVVAATDVAIYGGLTALATFDRPELKKKVLDDLQFRNFLELAPEVREIINDFYESKYSTCFKALNKIKVMLSWECYRFNSRFLE
jgi:COP9 signalosome complex subunit 1